MLWKEAFNKCRLICSMGMTWEYLSGRAPLIPKTDRGWLLDHTACVVSTVVKSLIGTIVVTVLPSP